MTDLVRTVIFGRWSFAYYSRDAWPHKPRLFADHVFYDCVWTAVIHIGPFCWTSEY